MRSHQTLCVTVCLTIADLISISYFKSNQTDIASLFVYHNCKNNQHPPSCDTVVNIVIR